ncbi:MAG: hypothetical protein AWM53_02023 [Candidatus Dichloromethanomonas elyunquensis]|nr:MAG: hypothetical protein AWM53_02023 [Candidatus Dichloromethanomonas elyunquensis]
MELFKWFIELMIKKLPQNEKCLYLANRLIEESGEDAISEQTGIAYFSIFGHPEGKFLEIDGPAANKKPFVITGRLTAKIGGNP